MVKASFYLILTLGILLAVTNVRAQSEGDVFSYFQASRSKGSLLIQQDPAIRSQVNMHLSQQVKLNGIRGYRISIFFGSGQDSKKNAELARANFVSRYEQVKCYTKFEYPYFKVYVGDFRTRSDALKFLRQIEFYYPDAFIREDIIAFPD
jgi:hypothetical protein